MGEEGDSTSAVVRSAGSAALPDGTGVVGLLVGVEEKEEGQAKSWKKTANEGEVAAGGVVSAVADGVSQPSSAAAAAAVAVGTEEEPEAERVLTQVHGLEVVVVEEEEEREAKTLAVLVGAALACAISLAVVPDASGRSKGTDEIAGEEVPDRHCSLHSSWTSAEEGRQPPSSGRHRY